SNSNLSSSNFKKAFNPNTRVDQARADQAAKDDQAQALISMTQKEKPELPPSSFSLSLSLVGIVKGTADTKINSLLDIPVQ
ncbi:hypothetical protein Tco_0972782, partial [Tanacetum coccineum]